MSDPFDSDFRRSAASSRSNSGFNSPSFGSSDLFGSVGTNADLRMNAKDFIDSHVKSLLLSPEQAADLHQIAKVFHSMSILFRLLLIYSFNSGV